MEMKLTKNHILIMLVILVLAGAMSTAVAYTGTGFSHNKTISDYSSSSLNDILNRYENTECHSEVSGLCTKVYDGDTIYVEGVGKVRLVGVNTPEKGVQGSEASKYFVEKLCLNREVSLDIDDSKHYDRYQRTLAVVIVDDKNLNEMLLQEGLAEIMYMPPSEFYPYDWANSDTPSSSHSSTNSNTSSDTATPGTYIGNSNTHKFHLPTCKWGNSISERNKVIFTSERKLLTRDMCRVRFASLKKRI